MAQNNAINNKLLAMTIDPSAASDSFIQFKTNSTDRFRIGADNTDSSFRISAGSALGTTDTQIITSAGEITQPLNPAFLAYLASDASNVTGDGTFYAVGSTVALTEVFDQNSDFNTNGTFTAPITGRYFLYGTVSLLVPSGGGVQVGTYIATSNRSYFGGTVPAQDRIASFYGNNTALGLSLCCIADMDAADIAIMYAYADGGAKTTDIDGDASSMYTTFGGYLLT